MKYVFVLLSAITLLSACGEKPTSNEATTSQVADNTVLVVATRDTMLTDTRWKLIQLSGAQVAESPEVDKMKFMLLQKQGNTVSGFSGCNTFAGKYELIGNEGLKFSQMTSTLTACNDMEIEKQFQSILAIVDGYDIKGDTLLLFQAQTAPIARFQVLR